MPIVLCCLVDRNQKSSTYDINDDGDNRPDDNKHARKPKKKPPPPNSNKPNKPEQLTVHYNGKRIPLSQRDISFMNMVSYLSFGSAVAFPVFAYGCHRVFKYRGTFASKFTHVLGSVAAGAASSWLAMLVGTV